MNAEVLMALALSSSEGPEQGLAAAGEIIQNAASVDVPDMRGVREALTRWGLPFDEHGQPIRQLFTRTKTLRVLFPPGWSRQSERGHVYIIDPDGTTRLRWYIHSHDPVDFVHISEAERPEGEKG